MVDCLINPGHCIVLLKKSLLYRICHKYIQSWGMQQNTEKFIFSNTYPFKNWVWTQLIPMDKQLQLN